MLPTGDFTADGSVDVVSELALSITQRQASRFCLDLFVNSSCTSEGLYLGYLWKFGSTENHKLAKKLNFELLITRLIFNHEMRHWNIAINELVSHGYL